MQPKFTAATLALTLGLLHAASGQAAGETSPGGTTKPVTKRPVAQAQAQTTSEDVLGRSIFQVLVGEFALHGGDVKLGVDAWSDLAIRSRDPQALARATEVASLARQYDLALELSRLWLEVEPDSTKAKQSQSSLFILSNRLDDLAPQLSNLLEQDPANVGGNLLQLNRLLVRHTDKKAVQKLVDRVAGPYTSLPESHFAMAQAAATAGDNLRAQSEIETALVLRPDWEAAALVRAQLQAHQSVVSAIDSLSEFVKRNPTARDARLTLARLLITEKRYSDARVQFDRLIKEYPDSPDVIYPVAMLALQQGDAATGRQQLEKLLKTEFQDKSSIHFFLGQLDEEQGKPGPALEHYRQVGAGDQFVQARSRGALILQKQGKLAGARDFLNAAPVGDADKPQLLFAEVQLLREAGRDDDSYALLESALAAQPDNLDLLYEAALQADRRGKPEVLETRLKHLLKLKPDHPQALNALGYSWADRNIHLGEAEILIGKAVKLAPEDPFIMDSQGWVLYRQGKLSQAQQTLERAYGIKADPEIAAHLGEVLWDMGRKDEASRLLKDAQKKNPENEVLAGIIKKLLP